MAEKTIQTRAFALKQRGKAAGLNVADVSKMGNVATGTFYRWLKGEYGHFNKGGLERCELAMDELEREVLEAQATRKNAQKSITEND